MFRRCAILSRVWGMNGPIFQICGQCIVGFRHNRVNPDKDFFLKVGGRRGDALKTLVSYRESYGASDRSPDYQINPLAQTI